MSIKTWLRQQQILQTAFLILQIYCAFWLFVEMRNNKTATTSNRQQHQQAKCVMDINETFVKFC